MASTGFFHEVDKYWQSTFSIPAVSAAGPVVMKNRLVRSEGRLRRSSCLSNGTLNLDAPGLTENYCKVIAKFSLCITL